MQIRIQKCQFGNFSVFLLPFFCLLSAFFRRPPARTHTGANALLPAFLLPSFCLLSAFFLPSFCLASANDSLGRLAARHGRYFGSLYDDCCIPAHDLPVQEQALKRYCTMITDAHFFMTPCHPEINRYDFEGGDRVAWWAAQHKMRLRGHTLVWYPYVPDWLSGGRLTPAARALLLERHIKTVVSHYRGRMYAWDVVNEPFEQDGSYRKSFYFSMFGKAYIEAALEWAHTADPDAKLFINDYNTEEICRKSNALYDLARDLVSRGVPLDGIGFQMHLSTDKKVDFESVARNLRRFAALGLELHFTEVDVKIREPATPQELALQASVCGGLMRAFLANGSCKAFIVWGLSDTTSWIPDYFHGYGTAATLDTKYRPKPAFEAIRRELER